jgi:hypothetical protein
VYPCSPPLPSPPLPSNAIHSADSSVISIKRVSTAVPSVKIAGPSYRTTYRTVPLSLFASASLSVSSMDRYRVHTSTCDAVQSLHTSPSTRPGSPLPTPFLQVCSRAKSLAYIWSIRGSNLASTSSDPRSFRLPANSLAPGALYNFTVTVMDTEGNSNNATTQVRGPSDDALP